MQDEHEIYLHLWDEQVTLATLFRAVRSLSLYDSVSFVYDIRILFDLSALFFFVGPEHRTGRRSYPVRAVRAGPRAALSRVRIAHRRLSSAK